jgi:aspartate aminotransferase
MLVPPPQAAFYLYPDFELWRQHLHHQHGVTTGAALGRLEEILTDLAS